ncbi:YxeA family protein [Salisediminibacterium selenitireducens]|uniref:YxeA family protein n=1 Tax=Bacillus selenitireducens (strain ATCC 700615 / DSM 15326 / MLS10) TaxID=439292 RepID=D6XXW0_BACIE|nr:YxeA family protein [Salisediminibacterium selenitireducens]ADI00153.1 conserved hypothetical protein [[Bacillus] selenitireducens MLS10]
MKKTIIILISTLVSLAVIAVVIIATIDFNRVGKDHAYTLITENGDTEETVTGSGEVFTRYHYSQSAFTDEGEEITVSFSSHKNLRHGAYLRLYMNHTDVTSYDEVQTEDVPAQALETLMQE